MHLTSETVFVSTFQTVAQELEQIVETHWDGVSVGRKKVKNAIKTLGLCHFKPNTEGTPARSVSWPRTGDGVPRMRLYAISVA